MHSHLFSHLQSVAAFPAHLFKSRLCKKLISSTLVLSLLVGPAQASSLGPISRSSIDSISILGAGALGILKAVFRRPVSGARPSQKVDTLSDRLSAVARIKISPGKYVGYEKESITFTALPTDFSNRTIQGVKFSWESSDITTIEIDAGGRATFLKPGQVTVTCRAGSAFASATVVIKDGDRPIQTDEEWRTDQSNLKSRATAQSSPLAPGKKSSSNMTSRAHAATLQREGPPSTDLAYDNLWSEAANLIGHPLNRAEEATRLGTVLPEGSNFNLSIPIISRKGRGVDLNLGLSYNSRLWSKRGNALAFDAITSWPSPGFTLGFGRIVTYDLVTSPFNSHCKFMLIDPDGTRHYLGDGNPYGNVTYKTSDGSNITYVGGASTGSIIYNDGSTVYYSNINNRLLAGRIQDSNGNYLTITYKPSIEDDGLTESIYGPTAIDMITDTLGRIIQFNYDASGKPISIIAPGLSGTVANPLTQTIVQFDYQNVTVNGAFSGGITVEKTPGQTIRCLRHVYFPATGSGYLFSYSAFGMIHNYSIRRQMSASGSPVTIQDGLESANVSFNYPIQATPALTEPPKFTQRTETAMNAPTAIYRYSSTPDDDFAQTRTFVITRPDSSTLSLMRSLNSLSVSNGLLVQAELKKAAGASVRKTAFIHVLDGGGSPQVQSVISSDDASPANQTKVDFDYDQYGNITNQREYGFQTSGAWQVQRRTRTTYKTDAAYINAYLRSLPVEIAVYDAGQDMVDDNDRLIVKTTYAYDNYVAMNGMEDYGGNATPPGTLRYYTDFTLRGNVTGTSQYTDITGNTAHTRLAKYDIFGNVVKAQLSCCSVRDLSNTEATYWSQPEEVISGGTGGPREITNYDFNTGVATWKKNAAGLQTNLGYDATLNVNSLSLPTGLNAVGTVDYSNLSSSSNITYFDGPTVKSLTSTVQYDGWGRQIAAVSPNNAQVNTSYDALGRILSKTNPFPAGGQPGPTTNYQYDVLGRHTITTLPDTNTVRTVYSGSTTTVTDQVGRKMKREKDGLGRLIKVTEQDTAGTLSQETLYSYNVLDKLVQVDQSGQKRSFKYDALGRLLYERIPEQTATINDGSGEMWTTKYTYTEFDAVQTKQDARGVLTTYGYDFVNRIASISYNTAGATGVAQTPGVNIIYTPSGKINQVSAGTSTETYSYDSLDRVQSVARWMQGQDANPSRTYTTSYQYNDASQPVKVTYPSGTEVNLSYDALGRLKATAGVDTVAYNLAGQVTSQRLVNGVTETFDYDTQRLQLKQQKAVKGGNPLMDLTYSYLAQDGHMGASTTAGNAGQLMSITGTINGVAESANYTYDNVGRLATSSQTSDGMSVGRRYGYDQWGNRKSVWNAASGGKQIQSVELELVENSRVVPTNRIISVTDTTVFPRIRSTISNYTYDAAGNVINDGRHTYQYDAENRVVSLDGAPAIYRYDHQNRRVGKLVGSVWIHYVWDGDQVITEHDSSTPVTAPAGLQNFSYGARSVRMEYFYKGSRLIQTIQSSWSGQTRQQSLQWYLSDRLSTRVVLDGTGNVIGKQSHLPFGEDFAQSGAQEKHHFTSYERDAESGMDYAVNRGYVQNIGRFNQADPYRASSVTRAPQSWNRYSYAGNDPINSTDPLGLQCYWVEPVGGAPFQVCERPVLGNEPVFAPEVDDSPHDPPAGGSADENLDRLDKMLAEYDGCMKDSKDTYEHETKELKDKTHEELEKIGDHVPVQVLAAIGAGILLLALSGQPLTALALAGVVAHALEIEAISIGLQGLGVLGKFAFKWGKKSVDRSLGEDGCLGKWNSGNLSRQIMGFNWLPTPDEYRRWRAAHP